ncbi:hypothetical protein ACN2WE_29605 [Streptomyces sp. cg28]|uniref:hypothetical protein n=1 Tax=Streptomyces sp. cg28 TaxID=3403457 RepID=UPI003B20E60F
MGVSSSFLRKRAEECETASGLVRTTLGAAADAGEDLARAADGWAFVGSAGELQDRWEALNKMVRQRLDQAAINFRLSADAYDENEVNTAAQFL